MVSPVIMTATPSPFEIGVLTLADHGRDPVAGTGLPMAPLIVGVTGADRPRTASPSPQVLVSRGSSTSRIASPSRLKPTTEA